MRMRDTLAQLAANRQPAGWAGPAGGRLGELGRAGSNPGTLDARTYIPANLPEGAPLVVVLHGCTQTAEGYDAGTGWSRLADREGFALLYPEQKRANNANLCFNWFQPADIARHGGEAESIAQMVAAMIDRHALDRQRIFITGLSAGGAMTAVMLATYPELFAGGAIIGGLAYGCAANVGEALARMAGRNGGAVPPPIPLPASSSSARGHWPTVSIWHGAADATVVVGNMDDIAGQWRDVHGVGDRTPEVEGSAEWERRTWTVAGRPVVETWHISGMGHGVPIGPAGPDRLGQPGPYMLPVGIDSTAAIARSWNLIPESARTRPQAATPRAAGAPGQAATVVRSPAAHPAARPASSVQTVIENALKAAGLIR